jgi:hypothetical protein
MMFLAMLDESPRLIVHCPMCNRVNLQFRVAWLAVRMTHVYFIDFGIVRLAHLITANDSDAVLRGANAFEKIMISSMFKQIIDVRDHNPPSFVKKEWQRT